MTTRGERSLRRSVYRQSCCQRCFSAPRCGVGRDHSTHATRSRSRSLRSTRRRTTDDVPGNSHENVIPRRHHSCIEVAPARARPAANHVRRLEPRRRVHLRTFALHQLALSPGRACRFGSPRAPRNHVQGRAVPGANTAYGPGYAPVRRMHASRQSRNTRRQQSSVRQRVVTVTANPNGRPTRESPGTHDRDRLRSRERRSTKPSRRHSYGALYGLRPELVRVAHHRDGRQGPDLRPVQPPVQPDRNVQFCFGATAQFPANSDDGLAQPGTLPDGTAGFIGLLPSCSSVNDTSPCIVGIGPISRNTDNGLSGTQIRVFIPESFTADPFGHP